MRKTNTNKVKLLKANELPRLWRRVIAGLSQSDQALTCVDTSHGNVCTHPEGEHDNNCCRRHVVILPGYGKRDYPFPTTDELVDGAIAYINALQAAYAQAGRKLVIGAGEEGDEPTAEQAQKEFVSFVARLGLPSKLSARHIAISRQMQRVVSGNPLLDDETREIIRAGIGNLPKPKVEGVIPTIDGGRAPVTGPELLVTAGTFSAIMEAGRYKAVIARQFDPLKGAVNWALENMPEKYHPTAESLGQQLAKLEEIYAEALPRVIKFLESQNPKASEQDLLDAAVSVLNQQLAEILYVLSIWTDSFAQQRDGMYKQLLYVVFTVEQALAISLGKGEEEVDHSPDGSMIKTHAMHLRDVFMARFAEGGPATIPGGRGPVGAHAIEVPFDEADVLVIFLPLYLHEFRHDFYNDVEQLAEQLTEAVVEAITKADKAGKFKFSTDKIMLGKQEVPLVSMITQVFAQTLSETDADLGGGVCQCGPAFLYSMMATFSAFNMRGGNAFNMNRLLRSSSYYAIGEQGELAFEPHMPDFMRVFVVADGLRKVGNPGDFEDEAAECESLGDKAGGFPRPTHIVWRNIDPKSRFKFQIKLAVSDLRQVVPVVVDAIMNTPLACLGGKSTTQLVNWTRKRQDKVDALVASLLAGKADIPWEMGDFWAPYVAAAAITAVWAFIKSAELPPMVAVALVEANARQMMDAVKAYHERGRAAAPAEEKDPAGDTTGGGPDASGEKS
jgi:hypothetical protein